MSVINYKDANEDCINLLQGSNDKTTDLDTLKKWNNNWKIAMFAHCPHSEDLLSVQAQRELYSSLTDDELLERNERWEKDFETWRPTKKDIQIIGREFNYGMIILNKLNYLLPVDETAGLLITDEEIKDKIAEMILHNQTSFEKLNVITKNKKNGEKNSKKLKRTLRN